MMLINRKSATAMDMVCTKRWATITVSPGGRPDNSATQLSAEKRIYRGGSFKTWETEDRAYVAELDMSLLDGPDTFLLTLNAVDRKSVV